MEKFVLRKEMTPELFANPPAEYRGAPFWAWNGRLETEEMKKQIDCFKEMGFGGFHIHSRTGMQIPYLSDEYMKYVRGSIEYAGQKGMLAWLYDEDRCPSGFAGGLVTKDQKFRIRYLVLTPRTQAESVACGQVRMEDTHACRSAEGPLLAAYDIILDTDGYLLNFNRISKDQEAKGRKWYAYLETPAQNPWYNYQTYADTLNKNAMDRFLEITYEGYKKAVGEYFDTTVPSIFTDEPQFSHKTCLRDPEDTKDVFFPWTGDLPETYYKTYKEDLLENLPLLVWESKEAKEKQVRYHFHNHVTDRFVEAFSDNCGEWCRNNRMLLTGHLMAENSLGNQTASIGEAMRSYRSFGIPGIDILCDDYEYTTAKQAQSASRQYGRPGVLSELYGVTNWDYDFRGHKLQGDWQAALGVTVRVPHLSWYTMSGEAKRDYPASIHYQSPWAEKYHLVEDHFARVNTAMTRGKAVVRIGIIHPIESYWLHFGTLSRTGAIREQMEENFGNLTKWMLLDTQDFDFICEDNLPKLCPGAGAPLQVGEMNYSTVILPQCETIRRSTLDSLVEFAKAGGRLIVMGNLPERVDGGLDREAEKLRPYMEWIPFDRIALAGLLETERVVAFEEESGNRTRNLIYQLRKEEDCSWLFIAQGVKPQDKDVAVCRKICIRIKGHYNVEKYDTLTGEIEPLSVSLEKENTVIYREIYQQDSLLLHLIPLEAVRTDNLAEAITENIRVNVSEKVTEKNPPAENTDNKQLSADVWEPVKIRKKAEVTLDEPNVLLLDMAEYALDEETYRPEEEILRADNLLRVELGWEPRKDEMAEPWAVPKEVPCHLMRLRFTIVSETEVHGPRLALENAEATKIWLDGELVPSSADGWFTDRCIKTVPLPDITPGKHQLELSFPFGKAEAAEWSYLLGDFHVYLDGREAVLIKAVNEMGFGNLAAKGLPFYGGNVNYRIPFTGNGEDIRVHVPQYRGALVEVLLDGERKGYIIYAPYDCIIKNVTAGEHILVLKVYGNRFNSFGQIHLCNPNFTWFGPDSYRTEGDNWCLEYIPRPFGIMTSPVISNRKVKQEYISGKPLLRGNENPWGITESFKNSEKGGQKPEE